MEYRRFKPKVDGFYIWIIIFTAILLAAVTVLAATQALALLIVIPVDLITVYFLITSLFGYVELRETVVFIKFGFFMKREIPYSKIRALTKEHKLYSDSMMSLKHSKDHVNIKYGKFDIVSVSVKDSDELIEEINKRRA